MSIVISDQARATFSTPLLSVPSWQQALAAQVPLRQPRTHPRILPLLAAVLMIVPVSYLVSTLHSSDVTMEQSVATAPTVAAVASATAATLAPPVIVIPTKPAAKLGGKTVVASKAAVAKQSAALPKHLTLSVPAQMALGDTVWPPTGYLSYSPKLAIAWEPQASVCQGVAGTCTALHIASAATCPTGVFAMVNFLNASGGVVDHNYAASGPLSAGHEVILGFTADASVKDIANTKIKELLCA